MPSKEFAGARGSRGIGAGLPAEGGEAAGGAGEGLKAREHLLGGGQVRMQAQEIPLPGPQPQALLHSGVLLQGGLPCTETRFASTVDYEACGNVIADERDPMTSPGEHPLLRTNACRRCLRSG